MAQMSGKRRYCTIFFGHLQPKNVVFSVLSNYFDFLEYSAAKFTLFHGIFFFTGMDGKQS
jgi:hypothetical protein